MGPKYAPLKLNVKQHTKGGLPNALSNDAWDIPIRCRGIQIVSLYWWPIVQDTGEPITHDKPSALTCPGAHIYLGRTSTYLLFKWLGSNSQYLGRQSSALPQGRIVDEKMIKTLMKLC